MKRFVSLCLVMVMLLSIGATQIFAAALDVHSAEESAALEIQPRAQLVEVPDYYYALTPYEGGYIQTPPVTKEIRVLDGYRLVEHGPYLKSIVNDGYYQNKRYASVARWEWSYELIPV